MNENQDEPNDSDPRVLEAAREYLAELEAGQVPDRTVYLMRNPDLASELEEFFDGVELAHAAGQAFKVFGAELEHDRAAPVVEPLGDFRIVREIGRGGMGVVYEAVQMSLGRRVALKVLPFAAALDARHLQRFRTEAHAAAQLHHTGIVPVYAVGCERGVHFYAMQLIDGKPLDAVIREVRGERFGHRHDVSTLDFRAGPTASPLAPKTAVSSQTNRNREAYRHAASMAMQAAEALEYAHDAGVVHRDIKPANLLLDAKGNVWVTDFGLAQVSADAGLTRTGDVVGTLRYMSPEQASGRRYSVDHRIDVYSLGATLYELLTLHPIFPGQDRQALLHQILNEEPRRPRDVDRGIPTELETVVLKAVAKAPEDRYRTAGEMAADLRRFLEDRPILARRPSLVDRGRKWLRRHPAYVGAAVLVLAFGVVALAASTTLVLREQQRTEASLEREKQRAAEVEVRFELARRSADEMIRIADEELADNLAQWALRRRLLETAVAFYQELIDLRRDDPSAQAELEATRVRVEAILGDLQVIRGAERHVLLSRQDVQDELKLSAVQRAKLEPVFQKMGHGMPFPPRENPPTSGRGRSRQLLDEMRTHEAAIAAILTPAQLDRLAQLALQRRGVEAFREPEVVAELDLDHDQREQLREIPTGPMGGPRFGGPPDGRRGPPEWRHDGERNFLRGPGGGPHWPMRDGPDGNAAMARALKILRPDQLAAWQDLTGPTFEPAQAGPRSSPGGPR